MDVSEILILLATPLVVLLPLLIIGYIVYRGIQREAQQFRNDLAEGFRKQAESLGQRLQTIEQHVAPLPPAAPAAPATRREKISEDKLMVIGAVLGCHFGKRVKVRSARLVFAGGGSNVWSQQGRAAVQASHRFSR